jgi:hypothetical protein
MTGPLDATVQQYVALALTAGAGLYVLNHLGLFSRRVRSSCGACSNGCHSPSPHSNSTTPSDPLSIITPPRP